VTGKKYEKKSRVAYLFVVLEHDASAVPVSYRSQWPGVHGQHGQHSFLESGQSGTRPIGSGNHLVRVWIISGAGGPDFEAEPGRTEQASSHLAMELPLAASAVRFDSAAIDLGEIDGLLAGHEAEQIIQFALRVADYVCTQAGATPPLSSIE
jgi:hypothetical protein